MSTLFARKSVLLLAWLALASCSSTPTQQETHKDVDDAEKTLADFMRDPQMTWLQTHIHEARAVMVSPRILQAGFVIGGSGGEVLVIARSRSGMGWNGPAFYHMGTGSLGLQAGAQSVEMVALVMSEKALNSLLSTSFKLGGDVSIAAGPIGAGTGAPITADIITYTRTKGLYGGINLDGTVITLDDAKNRAFYGRTTTPVEILIERSVSNPYGERLGRVATAGVHTPPVK
ncbi:MAG: lipid-binding SYLF domain-containing protein [Telluria sp.]